MATSYQIIKDENLVIVTTRNEIDINETIQSLKQMFDDPDYSPEYDLLWDATDIANVPDYEEMQKLVQHFRFYQGNRSPKRAIVVSRRVNYALTRVFHTITSISSRARIGLFEDRAEALRWLKR
jgi:hypothetical protein